MLQVCTHNTSVGWWQVGNTRRPKLKRVKVLTSSRSWRSRKGQQSSPLGCRSDRWQISPPRCYNWKKHCQKCKKIKGKRGNNAISQWFTLATHGGDTCILAKQRRVDSNKNMRSQHAFQCGSRLMMSQCWHASMGPSSRCTYWKCSLG